MFRRVLVVVLVLFAIVFVAIPHTSAATMKQCSAYARLPAFYKSPSRVSGMAGANLEGCKANTRYSIQSCLQYSTDSIYWQNLSCRTIYRTTGDVAAGSWSEGRTYCVSKRTYIHAYYYRMRGKLGSFSTVYSDPIGVDRYAKHATPC